MWRLFCIRVCQPVTTVSAKVILSPEAPKNRLRNRIREARLTALALMNTHPDCAPHADIVIDAAFLRQKNRRIAPQAYEAPSRIYTKAYGAPSRIYDNISLRSASSTDYEK